MPKNEMKDLKSRMQKIVEHLEYEFSGIRTGRAHPALVSDIKVDYYGASTPLQQLAGITIPEARQILISPFDKTATKAIEKAIQASNLGVNPQTDGDVIRINLPELTNERRVELSKLVKKYAEEARVGVRNIRRDSNENYKKLEKDSVISEDEMHDYLDEVQKVTDEFIEQINDLMKAKEEEVMAVN